MVQFFIIKTRTGDYYYGINSRRFDEVLDRFEEPYLYVKGYKIPRDNIDYYRTVNDIRDFIHIAKECGFYMSRDFKIVYLQYLQSEKLEIEKVRAVMYLLDL